MNDTCVLCSFSIQFYYLTWWVDLRPYTIDFFEIERDCLSKYIATKHDFSALITQIMGFNIVGLLKLMSTNLRWPNSWERKLRAFSIEILSHLSRMMEGNSYKNISYVLAKHWTFTRYAMPFYAGYYMNQ